MSEFAGPADDSHSHGVGCAEVIAEVWTLLDGECTPRLASGYASTSRHAPDASSITGSRNGSRR